MNIQDITRAIGVKRFHIVETSRPHNLAEHSFLVAMIAVAIAEEMKEESNTLYQIMWYGMNHDLHEITDGDIPTPTKEKWGMDSMPPGAIPQNVYEIVKCADLISDAWFMNQYASGRHSCQVAVDCVRRYEAYLDTISLKLRTSASKIMSQIMVGVYER